MKIQSLMIIYHISKESDKMITEDMGTKELADLLEEKGLVRDARLFYVQEKLSGFKLQPGVYKVSTSMTARELMAAMTPVEEEAEE